MPSVRSFLVGQDDQGQLIMQEPPLDDLDEYPDDAEDTYIAPEVPVDEGSQPRQRLPRFSCLDAQSEDSGSGNSSEDSTPGVTVVFVQNAYDCFRRASRFLLTNPIISVLILLGGIAFAAGLGVITIMAVDPPPNIDKSFDAFAIPNHKASRQRDALDAAVSEMRQFHLNGGSSIGSRKKRDISNEVISNIENIGDDDFVINVVPQGGSLQDLGNARKVSKSEFVSFLNDRFFREEEEEEEGEREINTDASLERVRRDAVTSGRIRGLTQAYPKKFWHMDVLFLARGDEDHNIFTAERLETIHEVEGKIKDHKGYTDHCYIDYTKWEQDSNLNLYEGCAPINSLTTYFYPSKTPDGTIHYDALGSQLDDINATLSFAMTKKTFFWYVDDKISSSYRKSKFLRSQVLFGWPLPGYSRKKDRAGEQHKKFTNFVTSYIGLLSKQSTSKVEVLYGSTELFDYQVDRTFWNDMRLAVFTFAFVILFMFILTSFSFWLMFWGMLSIILSFPVALFFYRVAFNVESLGILNGAAAFVIIGIGVDDVFVFINTFRQADHMTDLADRMVHTVLTAGKATFFTSFTTAAAFAANVASSIPAVHEFGLFMSLIVACCWLMVVILMPPVINLWFRYFSKCENFLFARCRCPVPASLAMPDDISHFLDQSKQQAIRETSEMSSSATTPTTPISDTDVQLLQMNGGVNNHDGGWPIYLGMLNRYMLLHRESAHKTANTINRKMMYDDDPLLQLEEELTGSSPMTTTSGKEGCDLTSKLRAVLYHFIAVPVVRARWFVFGGYLVLLAVSIGLMIQLRPASKPPQMFREDTNLQRLLDLAANISDVNINCDLCSGFFQEHPVTPLPTTPRVTSPGVQTTTTTTTAVITTTTPTTTTTTKKPTTTSEIPWWQRTTTTASAKTTKPTWKPPTTTTSTTISTTTTTTTTTTPTTTSTTTEPTATTTTRKPLPPTVATTTTKIPSPPVSPTTGRPKPSKPPPPDPPTTSQPSVTADSVDKGYNPCDHGKCDNPEPRPNLELGAAIYVVFGIKDVSRTKGHVLSEGKAVYDEVFQENFKYTNLTGEYVRDLCRICRLIANNTKLVTPGGSQCIPNGVPSKFRKYLNMYKDCQNLPENVYLNRRLLPTRAMAGFVPEGIRWITMAFESTTYKGQSYFNAYSEYQDWEQFIEEVRDKHLTKDSPLYSIYQTSDFWKEVMMEIVAVSSAIYGLVFSMIICVAAVAIFTGHVALLLIVVMTMFGMICMVVGLFYLAGWELGAVEALSLSILVGSSVDYCVHLVEGYLLAGESPPPAVTESDRKLRMWRTLAAMSHIGVSIVSSAVTTIIASIPLTQTVIRPFSKFGQIVAINTTVSIFYTLTACAAFLALFAPARFKSTWRACCIALFVTACIIGTFFLILYIISRTGVDIPGPNGQNLFPS